MRKVLFVSLFIFLSLLVFTPVSVSAMSSSDGILIAAKKSSPVTSTSDINDWGNQYEQSQTCNSLLGNPSDENSVAWLINKILVYATIIGMLLVVVLSSIDFLKVIAKSDDEAMAKATKKLFLRLVFAALLFFVPTLTTVLLDVFGLTSDCSVIQQG